MIVRKVVGLLAVLIGTGYGIAVAGGVPEETPKADIEAEMLRMGKQEPQDSAEVQVEFLKGRCFKDRHIDLYNVHAFKKMKDVGAWDLYYGLTVSRAVGYTTEDGIYRDSGAVGLGPALMMRYEKAISGKLYGAVEGTGSLLFYNRAHPGDGRAYGFLWRIGPRLTYRYTEQDAVSLAYLFHHASNGMGRHNPGYNGIGFSMGYQHRF